jgi:hypothetical protein
MSNILSRLQQGGREPMGIAQGETCVDQNGIPFSVKQSGSAVKANIAMLKDLVIQCHIRTSLQLGFLVRQSSLLEDLPAKSQSMPVRK